MARSIQAQAGSRPNVDRPPVFSTDSNQGVFMVLAPLKVARVAEGKGPACYDSPQGRGER